MVWKFFSSVFLVFLLVQFACGIDEKTEDKKDEKSVSKRGILHLNINGHHIHTPTPHLHASVPHVHSAVPHVHAASPHFHVAQPAPHFHLPTPHVHHHVQRIPVVHKPVVIPPYHIHHGGATVTSFNVNYPKYPVVHKVVPAVIPSFPHHHAFVPHHHHGVLPHSHFIPQTHSIYPHFHVNKPIVPVAVPVPGIRVPKYPVYVPQKPIFIHSKPQFYPALSPSPTYVPIPIPTESSPPLQINPGSEKVPNNSCISENIQQNHHHQGSWQPITNFMLTRPTQSKFSSPPYNYHAHKLLNDVDNFYKKMMNNFQVSGQGWQQSGQQWAQYLAPYQQQSQQLIQESQSNFFFIKIFL